MQSDFRLYTVAALNFDIPKIDNGQFQKWKVDKTIFNKLCRGMIIQQISSLFKTDNYVREIMKISGVFGF